MWVLIPASLCIVVAACAGGDAAATNPTVVDSAGVTVVENPAAALEAAERWSVDPEPELDLGTVDGEAAYRFTRLADAMLLSDGRVVAADAGSGEIRYYGPDGRHLRTVGGEGSGPGEFRSLQRLVRLEGDSVLAHDWRNRRLSIFGPSGDLVREQALGGPTPLDLRGWLADPGLVVARLRIVSRSPPVDGRHQRTLWLVGLDRSGTVEDTLLSAPGGETYVKSYGDRFTVTGLPFGRSTRVAVATDRLVTGYTERFEYRVREPGGDVRRIVRTEHEPRPVTDRAVDRFIDLRTEGIEREDRRRRIRELYREAPTPETMPAFQDLMVDAAERVWVRAFEPFREEGSRWTVFDPDGRVRAVAELPARFTPLQIMEDRVLGRWRDELDVEHVRLYRLARDEGAEG